MEVYPLMLWLVRWQWWRGLDVKFLHCRLHGPAIAANKSKPGDTLLWEVITQSALQNKTFEVRWYLYGTWCWNSVPQALWELLAMSFLAEEVSDLKMSYSLFKKTKIWIFHICCLFLWWQMAVSSMLPARAFQQGRHTSLSLQSIGDFSLCVCF